ncbi:efflux RND transporter periplasmic adaptor subunit [Thiohalocapsa marina]|uniref:Efflux RND transporter periplasmic adaptor subunit n=2 Tax=Thiohalocapsa marina TaxID=424902 RepID=A0A5M8FI39_9GAMM|nr:efflux RND transporter periplasmic adaptor subunit [Thiohalocapsa marina]
MGCSQQGDGRDRDGAASPASPPSQRPGSGHLVTAITTQRAPVSAQHERPGTLRLRRLVRLYSQEEGRITALDVFEGDAVRQGQVLARIEDDLLRAELDKARATRAQEALDVERLADLTRRKAASEDELAQARTALAVAEAEVRLLQTRLDYTRVEAPFAGVITERLVEPGDFVTKKTHLLTLADPASLIAEVYVSELVLPQVALGDPVRLRIDALGGQPLAGTILRIHPTLSETSRQAPVEVRFERIPDGARAGQFIRAELTTAAVPRLLVPFRALRQDRDGQFVWIIGDDGTAVKRPVQSGLRIADDIEILTGLAPAEQVITRGFLGLTQGKAVTRAEPSEQAAVGTRR